MKIKIVSRMSELPMTDKEELSPCQNVRGTERKGRQRRGYSKRCNGCSYACCNYEEII